MLLSLLALLLPPLLSGAIAPAQAAGFQAKTMQAPFYTAEVERPLLIGRGWIQYGLNVDYKRAAPDGFFAGGQWTADGEPLAFANADWTYVTPSLDIRYGVGRHMEVYASLPYHFAHLTNDALGTDTSNKGLGDPTVGFRRGLFYKQSPMTSAVVDVWYKSPLGQESPNSYIGGSNSLSTLVLSTGTPDIGVALRAKRKVGPLAITGSAAYVRRKSSVTQWVVEVNEYQFQGRFKPGDEVRLSVEPTLQLGPIALAAEVEGVGRGVARAGTTASGRDVNANLDAIEGSDGKSVDVRPSLTFNAGKKLDLEVGAGFPVMGEDLQFFPLEDLQPTRGRTVSGSIEFRY